MTKFKVDDMVRVIDEPSRFENLYGGCEGKVVYSTDTFCVVEFESESGCQYDWGIHADLEPVDELPRSHAYLPDHVADWLDTLSPEQMTAILTDAYHEHQCGCTGQPGEIWRDEDGDLMMVTDEDCAETDTPAALYLTGPTAGTLASLDYCEDVCAYPSFQAAVNAGAFCPSEI